MNVALSANLQQVEAPVSQAWILTKSGVCALSVPFAYPAEVDYMIKTSICGRGYGSRAVAAGWALGKQLA